MLVVRNSQRGRKADRNRNTVLGKPKGGIRQSSIDAAVKTADTPNIIKEVIVWQTTKKSESG
jgi:hypothetical protein